MTLKNQILIIVAVVIAFNIINSVFDGGLVLWMFGGFIRSFGDVCMRIAYYYHDWKNPSQAQVLMDNVNVGRAASIVLERATHVSVGRATPIIIERAAEVPTRRAAAVLAESATRALATTASAVRAVRGESVAESL